MQLSYKHPLMLQRVVGIGKRFPENHLVGLLARRRSNVVGQSFVSTPTSATSAGALRRRNNSSCSRSSSSSSSSSISISSSSRNNSRCSSSRSQSHCCKRDDDASIYTGWSSGLNSSRSRFRFMGYHGLFSPTQVKLLHPYSVQSLHALATECNENDSEFNSSVDLQMYSAKLQAISHMTLSELQKQQRRRPRPREEMQAKPKPKPKPKPAIQKQAGLTLSSCSQINFLLSDNLKSEPSEASKSMKEVGSEEENQKTTRFASKSEWVETNEIPPFSTEELEGFLETENRAYRTRQSRQAQLLFRKKAAVHALLNQMLDEANDLQEQGEEPGEHSQAWTKRKHRLRNSDLLQPFHVSMNVLINAGGDIKDIYPVYEKMLSWKRRSLRPNAVTFDHLIEVAKPNQVRPLLYEMTKQSIAPKDSIGIAAYRALASTWDQESKPKNAAELNDCRHLFAQVTKLMDRVNIRSSQRLRYERNRLLAAATCREVDLVGTLLPEFLRKFVSENQRGQGDSIFLNSNEKKKKNKNKNSMKNSKNIMKNEYKKDDVNEENEEMNVSLKRTQFMGGEMVGKVLNHLYRSCNRSIVHAIREGKVDEMRQELVGWKARTKGTKETKGLKEALKQSKEGKDIHEMKVGKNLTRDNDDDRLGLKEKEGVAETNRISKEAFHLYDHENNNSNSNSNNNSNIINDYEQVDYDGVDYYVDEEARERDEVLRDYLQRQFAWYEEAMEAVLVAAKPHAIMSNKAWIKDAVLDPGQEAQDNVDGWEEDASTFCYERRIESLNHLMNHGYLHLSHVISKDPSALAGPVVLDVLFDNIFRILEEAVALSMPWTTSCLQNEVGKVKDDAATVNESRDRKGRESREVMGLRTLFQQARWICFNLDQLDEMENVLALKARVFYTSPEELKEELKGGGGGGELKERSHRDASSRTITWEIEEFNDVLRLYASRGDVKECQALFQEMHNLGLKPTPEMLHAMIDLQVKQEKAKMGTTGSNGPFAEMKSLTLLQDWYNLYQVPPLGRTLALLLRRCLQLRNVYELNRFQSIAQQLKPKQPPNVGRGDRGEGGGEEEEERGEEEEEEDEKGKEAMIYQYIDETLEKVNKVSSGTSTLLATAERSSPWL